MFRSSKRTVTIERPWDATPEERKLIEKEFQEAIRRELGGQDPTPPSKPPGRGIMFWLCYWVAGLSALAVFPVLLGAVVLAVLCMLKYLRS